MTTYNKEQLADLKNGLLIAVVPYDLDGRVQQSGMKIQSSESDAFINALKYEYSFSKVALCSKEDLQTLISAPESLNLVDLDGAPIDFSLYPKEKCFLLEVIYGSLEASADYQVLKNGEPKRSADADELQSIIENSDIEYDRYRRYIQQLLNDGGYWNQKDFFTLPVFVEIDDWEIQQLKKQLKQPVYKGGRVYTTPSEFNVVNQAMYSPSSFNSLVIQRLFPVEKSIRKKTYVYNNTYSVLLNFQMKSDLRYSSSIALFSELLQMKHTSLNR